MSQPKKYTTLPTTHKYMELHVDNVITRWAEQNIARIVSAYTQKGGWEGWAQVEIATALQKSRESSSADVALRAALIKASREVDVYAARDQLADIVIESKAPMRRQFVIIELKCEGFHNTNFAKRVADDIVKLKGTIKDEFKPARAWALAISTSQKEYDKMRKFWPTTRHKVLYDPSQRTVRSSPGGQSTGPKIVLWVFQRDVVKQ